MRPVEDTYALALFEIKSDPEVTDGYGHKPYRSIEETRAWIDRCVDSPA